MIAAPNHVSCCSGDMDILRRDNFRQRLTKRAGFELGHDEPLGLVWVVMKPKVHLKSVLVKTI
jgi:hypothetical protein